MMRLSDETTEELIDLLELIAAGSTAPTLPSRANAILVHVKLTGASKALRPPTRRQAERMARNEARREAECPDGCGIDPETDDWSDAHYCGTCGMNHAFPGKH
jgi:hypothetical protein